MKKIFLILFLLCVVACAPSDKRLYQRALDDSRVAELSEIHSLVTFKPTDEKALLVTWHNRPDIYQAGDSFESHIPAIWAVEHSELLGRFSKKEISCTEFRMLQLLGMSKAQKMTHFSLVEVKIDDLLRPAYQMNVRVSEMSLILNASDKTYKEWFYRQQKQNDYPWTALGYTYDWSQTGDVYGLSEFIIKENAEVKVIETLSTDDFLVKYCVGAAQ